MLTIETKKLKISDELKRKVEMICKFANVKYTFENGNIINIKETNIAYVKPHVLKIKNNEYLIFPLINSYLTQANLHIISTFLFNSSLIFNSLVSIVNIYNHSHFLS